MSSTTMNKTNNGGLSGKQIRKRRLIFAGVILVGSILLTIGIVLFVRGKNDGNNNNKNNSTSAQDAMPSATPAPTFGSTFSKNTYEPTSSYTTTNAPTFSTPTISTPTSSTPEPSSFEVPQEQETTTSPTLSTPTKQLETTLSPTVSTPTVNDVIPSPTASPQDLDPDVLTWLQTNVTLADGVQFEILQVLDKDDDAFTQGLTFANGSLYESTGLWGESTVRHLDPDTGLTLEEFDIPSQYFGEGMVYIEEEDALIQITWKSQTGFVYRHVSINPFFDSLETSAFSFETTRNEGWGVTCNGGDLIVSDGSNVLHFWSLQDLLQDNTQTELRTLQVFRQNGSPATNLNELEFWRGRILANVWYADEILVINPETGQVEKEYDFSQLWPDRPSGSNVLNGISVSADPDILYFTGKLWNKLFRVKLLP